MSRVGFCRGRAMGRPMRSRDRAVEEAELARDLEPRPGRWRRLRPPLRGAAGRGSLLGPAPPALVASEHLRHGGDDRTLWAATGGQPAKSAPRPINATEAQLAKLENQISQEQNALDRADEQYNQSVVDLTSTRTPCRPPRPRSTPSSPSSSPSDRQLRNDAVQAYINDTSSTAVCRRSSPPPPPEPRSATSTRRSGRGIWPWTWPGCRPASRSCPPPGPSSSPSSRPRPPSWASRTRPARVPRRPAPSPRPPSTRSKGTLAQQIAQQAAAQAAAAAKAAAAATRQPRPRPRPPGLGGRPGGQHGQRREPGRGQAARRPTRPPAAPAASVLLRRAAPRRRASPPCTPPCSTWGSPTSGAAPASRRGLLRPHHAGVGQCRGVHGSLGGRPVRRVPPCQSQSARTRRPALLRLRRDGHRSRGHVRGTHPGRRSRPPTGAARSSRPPTPARWSRSTPSGRRASSAPPDPRSTRPATAPRRPSRLGSDPRGP